ncbi:MULTISPECIES: hypothetical protein [unclassified Chryseobacterium]|uniref:hypothetical protein n=1 Tax=unclassified Chryseobacterium TaxID=2593645 RepID=UPI0011CECAB1|nr:hypothetical protein [Chryseobacterium sp. G0240]
MLRPSEKRNEPVPGPLKGMVISLLKIELVPNVLLAKLMLGLPGVQVSCKALGLSSGCSFITVLFWMVSVPKPLPIVTLKGCPITKGALVPNCAKLRTVVFWAEGVLSGFVSHAVVRLAVTFCRNVRR